MTRFRREAVCVKDVCWCVAARGQRGQGHAGEALREAYLRRSGDAEAREVLHVVRRAPFDTAGSSIRRAAVEVGLLRVPPMAVPLATVHAGAPTPRAPDAPLREACCNRRCSPEGEIGVVDRSKRSPPLPRGQGVRFPRLAKFAKSYPPVPTLVYRVSFHAAVACAPRA